MTVAAQPLSPVQHRWRWIGWLLYLAGYCLMAQNFPDLGLAVFALGMFCHWRFWRWALPLSVIAFCFGYWRGTRKAAERRRTSWSS